MTKRLSRAATLAAIAALAVQTPALHAQSDNAAEVWIDEEGDTCKGFVPDENGAIIRGSDGKPLAAYLLFAKRVHRVRSGSGVYTAICSFDVPDDVTPASVRTAQGFGCGLRIDGRVTLDSRMQVTPGGRGLLVCRLRS